MLFMYLHAEVWVVLLLANPCMLHCVQTGGINLGMQKFFTLDKNKTLELALNIIAGKKNGFYCCQACWREIT